MLKKSLVSFLLGLGFVSVLNAGDLKNDMSQMSRLVNTIQYGFLANKQDSLKRAVPELRKYVQSLLDNQDEMIKRLPKGTQYKSSIAVNSGELIVKYAEEIEKQLNDPKEKMITRHLKAQEALSKMEFQCFRCHNLIRDWDKE